MNIAVTGGMGTGKSSVAALLGKILAFEVLNADLMCRLLLFPGNPGWLGLRERWENRFFEADGSIDRVALRQKIFVDATFRHELEEILHPLVRQQILDRIKMISPDFLGTIVEVPLLFEVGWQRDFDNVLVVYADEVGCLERIVKRDQVKVDDAKNAFLTQLPLSEKVMQADSVIDNSGSWVVTSLQIYHLAHYYRQISVDYGGYEKNCGKKG